MSGLNKPNINRLEIAVSLLKNARNRDKNATERRFRLTNSKRVSLKSSGSCVICGHSKAVDYCHIIPVFLLKNVEEHVLKVVDVRENTILLCKNHHWCFDHMKLDKDELEKIYQNKKHFIDNTLFWFVNIQFKKNPHAILSAHDELALSRYSSWIKWIANHFFVKN